MAIKVLIITVLVVLILLKLSYLFYPVAPMQPGKKIAVFMDNKYNRTATICKNLVAGVVIYDRIMLPVHYRNKFYAVGYLEDGHKLLYITNRKLFWLAYLAEIERKYMGCPDYNDPTIEDTPNIEKLNSIDETEKDDKDGEK
jgi:hypothetical protein